MRFKTISLVAIIAAAPGLLHAQFEFKLDGRSVQVHSFASQGFGYSNDNNYMTMKTSKGSFAMTDAGANISTTITDHFRVGAQIYLRNVGNLGNWQPHLDWAFGDYRFKDWFGIRGGKVKTALGLFNDMQDNDSLHTFALLPQSVYPTDLRDATIAHTGGDIYGNIAINRLGRLAYTAYAGHRQDPNDGGYLYLLHDRGIFMTSYGGLQYGADLKWTTPFKGVVMGASHMREEITGTGTGTCNSAPIGCSTWLPVTTQTSAPGATLMGKYEEHSLKDQTNLGYAEYTIGNLRLDGEYRRYWRDQIAWNGLWEVRADTRGWYTSAAYRFNKWLELGSYYSRYACMYKRGSLAASYDTSLPDHHLYDKTVTARFDLTKFWIVKVEGHFMDGYGSNQSPIGFYAPDNPQGFQPNTKLLIVRTGFSF